MRFSDAIAALKAANSKPSRLVSTYATQLVTNDELFGKPPAYNARDLAKLYEDNPFARSCVDMIARRVSEQRWYFEKPDGERVNDHPALKFIHRGNRWLPGRQAMRVTQTLLELQGEAFWLVGRNRAGVPVEFAPIPANWVLDTPSKTINGFRIQPRSGVAFMADPEDVIHFKNASPVDPYARGASLANAARVELECETSASGFVNNYFKNSCRPDYIISGTPEAPLNATDVARIETTINEKFRGFKRGWRPFFSASKLEIQQLGTGLKDNDVAAVRELARDNIAQIWNIPPEMFGRLDTSNKSTIDVADEIFSRNVLAPRLALLEDYLQPFVEDEFAVDGLELHFETPIKENLEHALEVAKAFPADFTRNEKRKLARARPVDNGDELFEQIDPNDAIEAANNSDGPNNDGKPPKGGKKPKKDADKALPASTTKALAFDDVVTVSSAHEDPQVRAEVTAMFEKVLGGLIANFGSELLSELEAKSDFAITSEVAEYLAVEVPELIGQIDATTRKELLATLTEGAAATEGVEALAKRVEDVFAEASKLRASTIGDTVATKLAGFTTQVASKNAGFERKRWISSRDTFVRDTHRTLNGQTKLMGEKFQSVSGAQALHPGAFGKAAEDINCRCAMRPLLEGEKAMTDDEFEAFYEDKRAACAKKIAKTARDVFSGQKAVVLAQIERIGGFRI